MNVLRISALALVALGPCVQVHAEPAASMAALPLRRDPSASDGSPAGWIFVVLLIAIAVFAIWASRTRKRMRPDGAGIERLESLVLSSATSLHAVRWADEELLLACAQGKVDVISRRNATRREAGGRAA